MCDQKNSWIRGWAPRCCRLIGWLRRHSFVGQIHPCPNCTQDAGALLVRLKRSLRNQECVEILARNNNRALRISYAFDLLPRYVATLLADLCAQTIFVK